MATELIKVSELPVKSADFGDGDLLIVAEYNGGTYVSKAKNAFKIGLDAAGYDSAGVWNIGLAGTVTGNELTISLKQKDGVTDPSAGVGRCRINFRSGTITNGGFVTADAVGATGTVISFGSTAGFLSGIAGNIYVYAINSAGSVEIAWSGSRVFDESELHTTTAEGGAGGADSKNVLYSTFSRSNVMIRLLGCLVLTEATAGTWATAPSKISLSTSIGSPPIVRAEYYSSQTRLGPNAICTWSTMVEDTHGIMTVNVGSAIFYATVNKSGLWRIDCNQNSTTAGGRLYVKRNGVIIPGSYGENSAAAPFYVMGLHRDFRLNLNDKIEVFSIGGVTAESGCNFVIEYVGD